MNAPNVTTLVDKSDSRPEVTQQQAITLFGLVLVTALGLYVRLYPALAVDFPVNDGGLFYLMTQELQRAGYALPLYTSYNSAQIPFAYPPLPFYVAAFITDVTGLSLLDVLHYLPPVITGLAIPAFY
ncbi:MAG: hypothetical protein M3347_05935, partial [Armatimonadota bacterium]|nr:hypothetical protein [Armatimonadota bacterium]